MYKKDGFDIATRDADYRFLEGNAHELLLSI